MGSLSGKNFIVVGASSGMGKAVAQKISANGGRVICVARREAPLLELADSIGNDSISVPFDMNNVGDIHMIFEEIRDKAVKLDGMFFSVGICELVPIRAIDVSKAVSHITLNAISFLEASRCFVQKKYSNDGASIVGISTYETLLCDKGQALYAGSKCCMEAFARVMAKEFASRRIKVNTISPAITDTGMLHRNQAAGNYSYEEINHIQSLGVIPAEEVADLAVFLLSGSNGHITGENIHISAGWIGE